MQYFARNGHYHHRRHYTKTNHQHPGDFYGFSEHL